MNKDNIPKPKLCLERAIEVLKKVKKRKGMFFIPSIEAAEDFVTGFYLALMAVGAPITWNSWYATRASRGWKRDSIRYSQQLKNAGLADGEIMDEIIDSVIETIQAKLDKTTSRVRRAKND